MQVHIAERHLLPKLLAEHGLSAEQLAFPREVLEAVASGWTREAGVRRLSQARNSGGCLLVVKRTSQDEFRVSTLSVSS